MALGYLGYGEAAYYMSKGLREAGCGDVYAFDTALGTKSRASEIIEERAKDAGVVLCSSLDDMLSRTDTVISALPARFSLSGVQDVLRRDLSKVRLLADVSTAKPSEKEQMEALLSSKGIRFVDGAMLGPLPTYAHNVPMLVSGSGAAEWREQMTPYGMDITIVEGKAGKASSIKLVRSVFMKGLETLLVETFLFARKSGVDDIIMDSLAATLDVPFKKTAQRMLAADLVHAERRSFEVEESIELMMDMGIEPIMAHAIVERLKKSAALGTREELGGLPPKDLSEVYAIWETKKHS